MSLIHIASTGSQELDEYDVLDVLARLVQKVTSGTVEQLATQTTSELVRLVSIWSVGILVASLKRSAHRRYGCSDVLVHATDGRRV